MTFSIGIDVGGTFTDVVVSGPAGALTIAKAATTPDQTDGVLDGIARAAAALGNRALRYGVVKSWKRMLLLKVVSLMACAMPPEAPSPVPTTLPPGRPGAFAFRNLASTKKRRVWDEEEPTTNGIVSKPRP